MLGPHNENIVNSLVAQAEKIIKDANRLKNTFSVNKRTIYHYAEAIEVDCEKLATMQRFFMTDYIYGELPLRVDLIQQDVNSIITEVARISCDMTDYGWFQMTMPFMPIHKEHGNNDYIRGLIRPALEWYFFNQTNCRYIHCFDQVYIIIRYIFADCTRDIRKGYIDLDNYEADFLRDMLTTYMLPTDTPDHVWLMHTSAYGEEARTEVYVVNRTDICKWHEWQDSLNGRAAEIAQDKFIVIPRGDPLTQREKEPRGIVHLEGDVDPIEWLENRLEEMRHGDPED